ncbi:phosphatase YfbT [Absidia repens]|uniref:Phosphatase YfbT n=1 Tax=Absidia repens TaxID=90262 RepID=A0A1X2IL51_9FUNG|nr:phosphatase YfbT [Absidia repens]
MACSQSNNISGLKGFIFDLDGTVVDTTPLIISHWLAFGEEHNLDGHKILATSHGRRSIETIAEWVPEKATKEYVDYYEKRLTDQTDGLTVLPGVVDLLKSIPFGKWGVYTGGSTYMAENRLKQCGFPIPDSLFTADMVDRGKPHPEGYLKAAERLGISPSDCVVFEDAPAGVRAGKSAGMIVIACTTTHTIEQLQEAGADHIVSFLNEVSVTEQEDGSFNVEIDN